MLSASWHSSRFATSLKKSQTPPSAPWSKNGWTPYKQRQIATVASLLSDDYVITQEDGGICGKVGFISYNAGSLRVDVAEVSDLKVRLHDNIAVVTGAYHEKGVQGGKPCDYHDRLTDVRMKTNGKWQLIASHYSLPANL